MNLIIRPARTTDAEVICEFNRRLAKETEHKDLDPTLLRPGVAAMLGDPRKGRYFVAERAPSPPTPLPQGARGEIVGQLGVTCEWSDWRNGNFWWIQSVYVSAEARRLGVFRKLYEHLLREARTQTDVIGVRLYVEHDNHAAQETYKKLGMVLTGYQVMEVYPL
ncbi:MAG: GNAT family N-acetyltransferase [Planctomycetes bacterium]|nr:GNAT family N-acetyltransferase [Planctomycetota bacterium]